MEGGEAPLNDLIQFCLYLIIALLGSEESRSAKVQKQEQYKRELQQQMQEQADIRKRYRSTDLCVPRDACYDLFCVFRDFYASLMQDAQVTKSLEH